MARSIWAGIWIWRVKAEAVIYDEEHEIWTGLCAFLYDLLCLYTLVSTA